jgi:Sugar (and other) transporter
MSTAFWKGAFSGQHDTRLTIDWSRWFYKATAGVEDFVEGADDDEVGLKFKHIHASCWHAFQINSRRNYVYWTIDNSPFQKWVVFVAGVGFFTDAYDIFALNVVLPILEIVYWNGKMPQSYETALIISTLVGTLIGQILFGFLADMYGRRKMYGLELLIVISATLGVAMSATGADGSMDIMGWLLFWRIMMGIGAPPPAPPPPPIYLSMLTRSQRYWSRLSFELDDL